VTDGARQQVLRDALADGGGVGVVGPGAPVEVRGVGCTRDKRDEQQGGGDEGGADSVWLPRVHRWTSRVMVRRRDGGGAALYRPSANARCRADIAECRRCERIAA